jgi:hypothetical protein
MMMRFADYQGEVNKTELEKNKSESIKKKRKIGLKKKQKSKEAKLPILFGSLLAYYFGHCWSNC